MSLYHHVANKEAIIDGIIDVVFSEIDLPLMMRLAVRTAPPGALGPCRASAATRGDARS